MVDATHSDAFAELQWLILAGLIISSAASALSVYILLILATPQPQQTSEEEKTFRSSLSATAQQLPSLSEPGSLSLSVIVPAYNEVERLKPMITSTVRHLRSLKPPRSSEIIVVDDGSTDGTSEFALSLAKEFRSPSVDIRVVTLNPNRQKGGAVKHGMMHARGQRLLFADADDASKFSDLELLWKAMDEAVKEDSKGRAVVAGSRAHLVKTDAVVKRSFLRNFLMYGFHMVLKFVGVGYIRDTQCGFKLFTRSAAQEIFPPLHLNTWLFDVELFVLARKLKIPVREVAIEWTEVPGSKMDLPSDSVGMLRDLFLLQANYGLGRWKTSDWFLLEDKTD